MRLPGPAAVPQRKMAPAQSSRIAEDSLEAKMFVDMVALAVGQGCNADEAEQQMDTLDDCCTHMKVASESSKHQVDSHSHDKT